MMRDGIQTLTGREKETLRLLLGGHDAKSVARHLGLSVHTVNERLRDTRRKLGVSSSREAARLLADAERGGPDPSGDKELGVAGQARDPNVGRPGGRRAAVHPLAWFGGGMLVMSLIIAAIVLSSVLPGPATSTPDAIASPGSSAESAGLRSARDWLALVDRRRWDESWRATASQFRSQVSETQWASTI